MQFQPHFLVVILTKTKNSNINVLFLPYDIWIGLYQFVGESTGPVQRLLHFDLH